MALDKRLVRFERTGPDEVIHEMLTLATRGDGSGWLNLKPLVAAEDRPPEPPIFKLFTARGPAVPLGTWVPGHHYRDRWQPTSVGLQHAGGRHASKLLEQRGVTEPAGWNRRQDHIKRGLVYELPEDQDPGLVLEFLMDAMTQLSGFPLSGRWLAVILTQP
ncbi:hypothetical protein [Candidatus Poriferisocius sp.]|uniref:hypothetical protein n=1 Tax=Candidatus Poriferisocius sp. TaxID=3101276 RepID=UPI003B01DE6C